MPIIPQCKVCQSPARDEIDALLWGGRKYAEIATLLDGNLNARNISDHWRNRHSGNLPPELAQPKTFVLKSKPAPPINAAHRPRRHRPPAPISDPMEKATRRERVYGISAVDQGRLFTLQSGACALCGQPATNLDHNHVTGEVRGFLCTPCNSALGLLKDNVEALRRAIEYLTNPPARSLVKETWSVVGS